MSQTYFIRIDMKTPFLTILYIILTINEAFIWNLGLK